MSIETLAELIAAVESNDNKVAVRFEPAHTAADQWVTRMFSIVNCSFPTARILCAMSWGKYQIMGDELMALGLNVSPLIYIQSDAMQDDFFQRYCLADHLSLTLADILTDESKRRLFARLYNGPGNIDAYMERMKDVATANGLKVS